MHFSLLVLRATEFLSTSGRFLLKVRTTGFLYGGQKLPLIIFNQSLYSGCYIPHVQS